jgi:SAM-dependent methyltransferase
VSGEPRARYTHGHDASVLASHRWRTAANSAAYLLASLSPGQSLLDVGCGPGTITLDLAAAVAPGRVVGVDASASVVEAASAAARGAGVENVVFAVGDAFALDFPDGAFEVVHAHQTLQHLHDPVAALREMRRVCRPGGLVAARDADYAAMTWAPADPRLDRWLELYRATARRNGGEPDAGRRLLGWAHAADLRDVVATAGVWCFATRDDRAWWGSTGAERISATALADRIVEAGLAARDELAEIASGWRAWAEQPDGWFAVLHGEIVARVEAPSAADSADDSADHS